MILLVCDCDLNIVEIDLRNFPLLNWLILTFLASMMMNDHVPTDNDDVNTKIFHSIADVFQKAQSTYAGHRKHIAVLKKIQSKAVSQGYESAFNYWFNTLVTKILPLKKTEIVGDRIVKLVAAFVASLDREIEILRKNSKAIETGHEEVFSRFVDQFVRHILRGVESKDKNVRYRVVQLLAVMMDNIGELDESLYNLLTWSLNKRVCDKEANVRIQAVFCLTKFQDEEFTDGDSMDDATRTLMKVVQNDASAEVRRAAMLNLVNNPSTQSYILERARDVNQVNRRLVYSRILRSMGGDCFEQVDSRIIDQLIKWGLEDREKNVRKACTKLISHDWLNSMDGDLIGLLEKLNVTNSLVAEKAMSCLFQARPDIIAKVKFPEDIWKEFTVEITFLLRCFYIHCAENKLTDVLEANFPEATRFADVLNYYIQERFNGSNNTLSEADKQNLDFILQQLLITANKYDFGDEIGRRSMLIVIRNMLGIFELHESLIGIGLQVLKSLSINENDFVTMAIEIINDIRDDDIEKQEQEENLRAKSANGNKEDEENDNLDSFHKVVEDAVSGKSMPSEQDIMKNLQSQKEVRPETVVACLTRSSHMLALVNMPLEQNILITSLIDTIITPAVRNTEPKIRELGVTNLGLCCLLDVQLATDNMYILGMCVSKGNASLKQIALKVIVDIFSVHGSVVVDGEGKVDSISLHKIFYKVLKNDDLPECQVVAAEGLCKLFLTDVFTDDDLFETLVLSYFSPANTSNEALIQAFAFCIPVYCFSHPNHQKRMSRIAADVLLRLCMLWDDLQTSDEPNINRDAMMKPNIIFQQLLHWTDPRKLINQTDDDAEKSNVQLDFVLDITKMLSRIDKKEIKKMLVTNINATQITAGQDYDKLKQALEHIEDVLENESLDSASINSLEKFKKTLMQALDDAYDRRQDKADEDSDGANAQYSAILESVPTEVQSITKNDEIPSDITTGSVDSDATSRESGQPSEPSRKRERYDDEKQTPFGDTSEKSSDTQRNVSFALPASENEGSDGEMSIDLDDSAYVEK